MKGKDAEYPYPQKGARKALDKRELRIFAQTAVHEGGSREVPAPAQNFARRFSAALTHYPAQRDLPNWLRAMIEKKASVEELAQTLHDRLQRAPSEENQELALIMANEIARMDGGSEVLSKHSTPELFARLSGKGGKEK
jgi:nitric oxide reductase activation protein